MRSPGGNSTPYHPISLAAATSFQACFLLAAAGALEAAARIAADPTLADSRLDAVAFSLWGIAAGAAAGIVLGAVAGVAFVARWGKLAASVWPAAVIVISWPVARLLEPWAGRIVGGWIALLLGIFAASMLVFVLSFFTPGDLDREPGRSRILLGLVVALIILGVPGFLGARAALLRPGGAGEVPNLLLITVDTLRADAIGALRNGRVVPVGLARAGTPRLDALVAESVAFTEASAPIPRTPQAIASIMTGNYPGRHGLRDLSSTLDPSNLTLAEILRDEGFRTRAVVTNLLIGRGSGIAQGFDRYHDKDGLRPQVKSLAAVDLLGRVAPFALGWVLDPFPTLRIGREDARETTDRAIRMFGGVAGRPYFLWVHYLDPHWTYWAPEPYRSEADLSPESPFTLYGDVRSGRIPIGSMIHHNEMTPPDVERVRSLYAGEVAYVDAQVGRLIDAALKGPGGENTIVVFTADHGESLGEHNYFFSHGDLVNEPSVRVPLLIRPAAGAPSMRISSAVSLVDLQPTLLEMLGAPIPSKIQGASLAPLIDLDAPDDRAEQVASHAVSGESDLSYLAENPLPTIPGEAGKIRFIRIGWWKLVRVPHDHDLARRFDPDLGARSAGRKNAFGFSEATRLQPSAPDRIFLYNLSSDPGETLDLAQGEPARVAEMVQALNGWMASSSGRAGRERAGMEEQLEGLRSLGYVP